MSLRIRSRHSVLLSVKQGWCAGRRGSSKPDTNSKAQDSTAPPPPKHRSEATEHCVAIGFGLECELPAMSNDGGTLSGDELVEYCQTQARLLAGRAETVSEETTALLNEIDEDIAEMRRRLAAHSSGSGVSTGSPTAGSDDPDEMAALQRLEDELEEKQAVVEAKQARMGAFHDLSEAYAELAAEVDTDVDDGQDALERVVRFERDHDAPAYFDDRQTLLEAAAESGE